MNEVDGGICPIFDARRLKKKKEDVEDKIKVKRIQGRRKTFWLKYLRVWLA